MAEQDLPLQFRGAVFGDDGVTKRSKTSVDPVYGIISTRRFQHDLMRSFYLLFYFIGDTCLQLSSQDIEDLSFGILRKGVVILYGLATEKIWGEFL